MRASGTVQFDELGAYLVQHVARACLPEPRLVGRTREESQVLGASVRRQLRGANEPMKKCGSF